MVRKSKTQPTRRSARIAAIQARTKSSNSGASTDTTKSAYSRRNVTAASATPSVTNKRKRKVVNEEGTSDQNTDKRLKQIEESSTSTSRNAIAPFAIYKSKVAIQDITSQVTTIAEQKWGKATSSVIPPTSKRNNNAIEEDHKQILPPTRKRTVEEDQQILEPKRRKWNTFTVPIPTRPKRIGQVYAIGSNDMSQCGGMEDSEINKLNIIPLEKFNIVDISAGALHSAALTFDGKVVTWGCNDHGTLGRFTQIPTTNRIPREANYNVREENEPTYAEGLDNVNIVKVVCGDNITFAISDQGHLYATGVFKGKDGIIGFSQNDKIEQPLFTRYTPLEHLLIVDIVTGANHALALTREGDVYAWGSNEGCSLGLKECELLVPLNTGLKHIVQLYAGAYHNFAIDDNNNVWVFGLNNMGQCGLDKSGESIIPPEKHSFFNKFDQNVDEIAAGQHHTLARMHDGQVFSFGRSDDGQLGLGNNVISDKSVITPTAIPGLTSIKFIGAREHFSMAVDTANNIYAWGFGETLVLGDKKLNETSPLQISKLEGKDIVRISCGSLHALFLVV